MNRTIRVVCLALAVITAGVGGYVAARILPQRQDGTAHPSSDRAATAVAPSGPVIYYRDPDGKPRYAADPRTTEDGRPYTAVFASEDISFDPPPPVVNDTGTDRRILYYRNPMGLADTSPTPKKDSMGMDYIPVYEGDEEEEGIVKISPGKLQRTGVRSESVHRQPIIRPIRVPGVVQLDERRITVVTTRSEAFIEQVYDVTTGDPVKAGQPLIRLYAPDIATAGAQYVSDLASGRQKTESGARQRLVNLGVPDDVISTIEKTRTPPISITWRAPRDGIVLERNAIDGMKMVAGDVLFRLADISVVWIVADIPEYDLGALRIGSRARISLQGMPGQPLEGTVSLIYPQINKETRTARIRIELPNPDNRLLPDMYADITIAAEQTEAVVSVPESAVIDTGTRQVVIIDRGEGRFEPRPVTLGARGSGYAQILSGINEGDRVVVSATFLIDAESNLKAALAAMTSGEDTP